MSGDYVCNELVWAWRNGRRYLATIISIESQTTGAQVEWKDNFDTYQRMSIVELEHIQRGDLVACACDEQFGNDRLYKLAVIMSVVCRNRIFHYTISWYDPETDAPKRKKISVYAKSIFTPLDSMFNAGNQGATLDSLLQIDSQNRSSGKRKFVCELPADNKVASKTHVVSSSPAAEAAPVHDAPASPGAEEANEELNRLAAEFLDSPAFCPSPASVSPALGGMPASDEQEDAGVSPAAAGERRQSTRQRQAIERYCPTAFRGSPGYSPAAGRSRRASPAMSAFVPRSPAYSPAAGRSRRASPALSAFVPRSPAYSPVVPGSPSRAPADHGLVEMGRAVGLLRSMAVRKTASGSPRADAVASPANQETFSNEALAGALLNLAAANPGSVVDADVVGVADTYWSAPEDAMANMKIGCFGAIVVDDEEIFRGLVISKKTRPRDSINLFEVKMGRMTPSLELKTCLLGQPGVKIHDLGHKDEATARFLRTHSRTELSSEYFYYADTATSPMITRVKANQGQFLKDLAAELSAKKGASPKRRRVGQA